ncbi:hypothetical protein LCGC14_2660150, partial [marine sediment metagenome]
MKHRRRPPHVDGTRGRPDFPGPPADTTAPWGARSHTGSTLDSLGRIISIY